MDKKTQFQLQTSQSKLIKYKETLETLLDARTKLEENASKFNPDRSKIIELRKIQTNLEAKLQLLKKDINLNVNIISDTKKNLLNLDNVRDNKYLEEDNILIEEMKRLEEYIIEVSDTHKQSILSAYLDKEELSNNIEIIKNELHIQNDIISEIQIKSHSSRKQILSDLHMKKQEKINNQQQINNIKETENDFTSQIQSLENINIRIQEFKKIMIDSEYNLDCNSDKLTEYYNEFSLDTEINRNLSINDKISILDKLTNDNQFKINYINKRFNKHKTSSNIILQNILDTYNKVNRVKIINSKHQYNIEKEKKIQLENILSEMSNKYNTFEICIIGKIDNDLENKNNEIVNDKIRANDRLNIMKQRILEDYENEKERLNNLITNSKSTLENIQINFNNINQDIDNTKKMIEKEDIIVGELDKIDLEIIKYQNIIKQIESDIENLSSRI
jgi:hypothetical protein